MPSLRNPAMNILVLVVACTLTFVAIELAYRAYDGDFEFVSERAAAFNLLRSSYPVEFNPLLGYVPRRGFSSERDSSLTVSIDDNGIRSNGQLAAPGAPILAIGDSFTFGDQVSDAETWPAALERLSQTRVINGGVVGYGIDQSYLRAMELMDKYKPTVLIFSFIADDIHRAELSQRTGVPKPYFELMDGKLEMRTAHVKEPEGKSLANRIKNLLAYSHAVHALMSKLAPMFWWSTSGAGQIQAYSNGAEVSCALLRQLARETRTRRVKLYLLPQYSDALGEDEVALIDRVLGCVATERVMVIDLLASLRTVRKQDPARFKSLFRGHMTASGNEFVAETILEDISARFAPETQR
jgi:hypothetical protein